jgi:L-methionine (R)-S-oxide reductase
MKSTPPITSGVTKADGYKQIYVQLSELVTNESDFLANSANAVSFLFHSLPDVNWVGFYFARERELVLGPFQGKPACTRIKFGEGVCGTAAASKETVVVSDVSQFPGHITCDVASRSEIVVPLLNWGRLLGVLDIDSPVPGRFDDEDREGLESLVALFVSSLSTDDLPDFEALATKVKA